MKKIAITIPEDQAAALERIRRRKRIPRSRVIQQALARYLAEESKAEAIRAYIEGYRKHPESDEEAEAFARTTSEVLGQEDWE